MNKTQKRKTIIEFLGGNISAEDYHNRKRFLKDIKVIK